MKQLDEAQLAQFDTHYFSGKRFTAVEERVDRDFPAGRFSLLDVGGGNGTFVDHLLERYPYAEATILDNAKPLLALNRPHQRKRLVYGSVAELPQLFAGRRFDYISFNFALHHFVAGSWRRTRAEQGDALALARRCLAPGGRISIYENVCESPLFEAASGYLIFRLTSSRALAPAIRRLGANTAGVGVLYLSERSIREDALRAGLHVVDVAADPFEKPLSRLKRTVLLLRTWRVKLFWLAASVRDDNGRARVDRSR